MSNSKHPRWGEIYYCDLGRSKGSVQEKIRPVLIIQNDIGNENGPTTVVAAISSVIKKMYLPTHILLDRTCGLKEKSVVMLEQIRTVDIATELQEYVGTIRDKETIDAVKQGLSIELGIINKVNDKHLTLCLSLCPKCRNDFLLHPENKLHRKNRMQTVKEQCDICQIRFGYEYVLRKKC